MKRWIFILAALLILSPWPVAYAYDNANAAGAAISIEAAPAPAQPAWKVYGGAVGGVTTPGALFYIDTSNTTVDVAISLYLTNVDELIHSYRYLNLKVGVYAEAGANHWEKVALPDTYITMQNGSVSFRVPGNTRYKVTIDGGSYYAFKTAPGANVSPSFYLAAE